MARNNSESKGAAIAASKNIHPAGPRKFFQQTAQSPKYFKSISPTNYSSTCGVSNYPSTNNYSLNNAVNNNYAANTGYTTPARKAESPTTAARLSPPGHSPRTSPGLLAGHYAGCKFTEPPLPSALPHPPQHWMQSSTPKANKHFVRPVVLFGNKVGMKQEPEQLTHQLKVLLKMQA